MPIISQLRKTAAIAIPRTDAKRFRRIQSAIAATDRLSGSVAMTISHDTIYAGKVMARRPQISINRPEKMVRILCVSTVNGYCVTTE